MLKPVLLPVDLLMTRRNGTLMASFPRSGSTLMSKFLADAMRSTLKQFRAKETVPSDFVVTIDLSKTRREDLLPNFPLISRTHGPKYINLFRTIFLFRNPEDSIYSLYAKNKRADPTTDIGSVAEYGIPQWKKLAETAFARHERDPKSIHWFHYEKFLADPVAECSAALDFIAFTPKQSVENLVSRMNEGFRNAQSSAPSDPLQPARGVSGGGAGKFPKAAQKRIQQELIPIYEKLCAIKEGRVSTVVEPIKATELPVRAPRTGSPRRTRTLSGKSAARR